MADPTVLELINNRLTEIGADVKDVKACVQEIDKKQENHAVRLKQVETKINELSVGQKKIKATMWSHINDRKKHYNQGFKETIPQRLWRRKDVITVATVVTIILGKLVEMFGG